MVDNKNVAIAILALAMIGVSAYLYNQTISLQAEVESLSTQTSVMTSQMDDLKNQLENKDEEIKDYATSIAQTRTQLSNYESINSQLESEVKQLDSDYRSLQSTHKILESRYSDLQESYDELQESYENLAAVNSRLNILESRYSDLLDSYDRLLAENDEINDLLDEYEKVPHSYYYSDAFSHHSNTFDDLRLFLIFDFSLPKEYEINVFDCSESSAYLEWALEIAGFDAEIAVGPTPWDPEGGYHAWVIVHTEEYKVAIEATALTGGYKFSQLFLLRIPSVVYWDDPQIPGWENYYEGYDYLYKNIYEAIRIYHVREWNWWEGYWGFT